MTPGNTGKNVFAPVKYAREFMKDDCNFPKDDINILKNDCNFIKDNVNFPKVDCSITKDDVNFPKNDFNFQKDDVNFPKVDCSIPKDDVNFPKVDCNFPKVERNFPSANVNFIKNDCNFQKVESEFTKDDVSLIKNDCSFTKVERNFLKDDVNFLKNDCNFQKVERNFPKDDFNFPKVDVNSLKNDCNFTKVEREFIKYARVFTGDSFLLCEDDPDIMAGEFIPYVLFCVHSLSTGKLWEDKGAVPGFARVKGGGICFFENKSFFFQKYTPNRKKYVILYVSSFLRSMYMRSGKDKIPRNDDELQDFMRNLIRHIGDKTGGDKPEWTHIPKDAISDLVAVFSRFDNALGPAKQTKNPVDIREKNRIKEELRVAARGFANTFLRKNKFVSPKDLDILRLGSNSQFPQKVERPMFGATGVIFFPEAGMVGVKSIRPTTLPDEVEARSFARLVYCHGIMDEPAGSGKFPLKEVPQTGDDLPYYASTGKNNFVLDLQGLSGCRIYLCMRYENAKGEPGPWGPMMTVVIP